MLLEIDPLKPNGFSDSRVSLKSKNGGTSSASWLGPDGDLSWDVSADVLDISTRPKAAEPTRSTLSAVPHCTVQKLARLPLA
jgi:hypothetical protein